MSFQGGEILRQLNLIHLVVFALIGFTFICPHNICSVSPCPVSLLSVARADIVLYNVPGTSSRSCCRGVFPRTREDRHVSASQVRYALFRLRRRREVRVAVHAVDCQRKLAKAARDKDLDACLDAARWALHNGLLDEFYEAASAAWKIDKDHPTVTRLAAMNQQIKQQIPESKDLENEMRKFVRGGPRMKFQRSDHFLLLHDTSDVPDKVQKDAGGRTSGVAGDGLQEFSAEVQPGRIRSGGTSGTFKSRPLFG